MQTRPPNPDTNNLALAPDTVPFMIWMSGTDKACHFFNAAWLAFTGHKTEEEQGDGWLSGVHPDDLQRCKAVYNTLSETRAEFTRVYRLRRHDGVYRQVTERAVPRYTADNKFDGYTGYCIDLDSLQEDTQLKIDLVVAAASEKEQGLHEEIAANAQELTSANEELTVTNEELKSSQENLAELNRQLETIVISRTKALTESEAAAQSLNEELVSTNEELAAANEELITINEELAENREEVQRSEKLFKSIALNIPRSLILVIDQDQRLQAAEGELLGKTGYPASEVGRHVSQGSSRPGGELINEARCRRVLNGERFTVDGKGNGDEIFRVEFVPLRNELYEVYAALIIMLDITDIKQAEEKSAKLAAIVASSDDAIISKTLDGIVTSWNAAAERIFGYTAEEMIGEPILKIIPDDRKDEEPRILERLRHGHRVNHFETKRVTKTGKILDLSLTISPVRDSEGNIIGASKIARDISEKKRDEQRKNDFIGMVSHELKTPLTSLTANVQLLQAKLRGNDDGFVTGALTNAAKQVKKMAGMINGFLNISRLESGKMLIVKQQFLLCDLLDQVIAETQMTTGSHLIQFSDGSAVEVNADREKIESVVLNLLNNAVKYSPKGSVIDVRCTAEDGKAKVSVTDRGIGISKADTGKLFQRYYRVENDYTRHISGFGIGLYLSAEIIRQHRGKIWVESEIEKGSTFYFTLPLG